MTRAALLAAAALGVLGCDPDSTARADGGAGSTPADLRFLEYVGQGVVTPTFARFADAATGLVTATTVLGAAASDDAALEAARAAWRDAMRVWQEAELLQLGPAGVADVRVGGADLRDEIYSWPSTNRCRIDQELVDGAFAEIAQELVNVRGLDAIEDLLFNRDAASRCPPQVAIVADGRWAAIAAELPQRRADYAAAAAVALKADADALVRAWGGFNASFVDGSAYGGARQGRDEVFAALFYLDLQSKDVKLAVPAGISPDCGADACPGQVESALSAHALANLVANLRAARALIASPGFEKLARDVGAVELADALVAALDGADAALAAVEGPLADAVVSRPAQVRAAYDAVKRLTDLLKTQLVTTLDLTLPSEGDADND